MIHLKLAWKWCKAHWRWLTLMALFTIAYLLGKNNAKNLLKMARLERDQYEKEKEQMKSHVGDKITRDKEAMAKYQKTIDILKKERDERAEKFKDMDEEAILKELGIEEK